MSITDDIIAIIPARGGSKGIRRKNLQLIYGYSLVEHSIIHAINAGIANTHIVVSSDDTDILKIADRYGVIPRLRPDEISGDTASTESALLDVAHNYNSEHILLLQPTSPIRFKETITGFLKFYLDGGFDSALTTTKFYNFFWSWDKYDDHSGPDGSWEPTYNITNRPRRQNMGLSSYQFFDNGNIYATRMSTLKKKKCRLGDDVGVYPISELEGMQIDTPAELQIFQDIYHKELALHCGVIDG